MSHPADWDALARYIAGESSASEVEQLESRLKAHPEDKALLDALAHATGRVAGDVPELDVEAALNRVKSRMNEPVVRSITGSYRAETTPPKKIRWLVPLPALAAVALVAIGIGYYLRRNNETVQDVPVTPARMVATGVGALDSVRLSDSSLVILGPMSSIKVAAGYGVQNRQVEIKGDAYLEVVHDSSNPFTVRADGATIQDIGTKFAVRTDSLSGVSVSVAEGSVSLQGVNASRSSAIILRPGDRAVLSPDGKASLGKSDADDMAWLRKQLVFREAPMSEVAASLHRWYGIELNVADQSLADRHLTATFSGEPPERVLDVIGLALGAKIQRRGDTAVIRAR